MMPRMRKEVNLEVQLQSMWQLHSQVTTSHYKSLSSHCYAAQEVGKRLVEEGVIGYGSTYCMRVLGQ